MKARSGLMVLAASVALVCWASLVSADHVGELEVQGDIRITQAGSGEQLRFRDTTFAVFAGDRLATGSGSASLRTEAGASLAIGPNSEVVLLGDSGSLHAELIRGTLGYLGNGSPAALRVNGQDFGPSGQLLMFAVDADGRLTRQEGAEAQALAGQSGLEIIDRRLVPACRDRGLCEHTRPRSISP